MIWPRIGTQQTPLKQWFCFSIRKRHEAHFFGAFSGKLCGKNGGRYRNTNFGKVAFLVETKNSSRIISSPISLGLSRILCIHMRLSLTERHNKMPWVVFVWEKRYPKLFNCYTFMNHRNLLFHWRKLLKKTYCPIYTTVWKLESMSISFRNKLKSQK